MLKRKLKDQRNLILWNGKYYVVNDLTFELLDMFDKNIKLKNWLQSKRVKNFVFRNRTKIIV